jgi:hypothetical protein
VIPVVLRRTRCSESVRADLEAIVLDCLAKQPESRAVSAQHLSERLRRCSDAGTWSEPEARAWWREKAALPGPEHPQSAPEVPRALRVDLSVRRDRSA